MYSLLFTHVASTCRVYTEEIITSDWNAGTHHWFTELMAWAQRPVTNPLFGYRIRVINPTQWSDGSPIPKLKISNW